MTIGVISLFLLVLTNLYSIGGLHAQEDIPYLFVEVDDPILSRRLSSESRSSSMGVVKSRVIELDSGVLDNNIVGPRSNASQSRSVRIALFDDVVVTLQSDDDPDNTAENAISWSASSGNGNYDYSIIVINEDSGFVTANIVHENVTYKIVPLGEGYHEVQELDQSLFPDELEPDELEPDELEPDELEPDELEPDDLDEEFDSGDNADDIVVDVLIAYTDRVDNSSEDIVADILLAIRQVNESFILSGINNVKLNLVGQTKVNYKESGNIKTDRNRLKNTEDEYLNIIHQLRVEKKADLVSLWVEHDNPFPCGVAYVMSKVSSRFRDSGFSVVRHSCVTGNYSFAHEIGHIFGARHDRGVSRVFGSPFKHNHGFVKADSGWRTIMGYNDKNKCKITSGKRYCTRIPAWSNPDIEFSGSPTGIAEGRRNAADNRLTIVKTAQVVAEFM